MMNINTLYYKQIRINHGQCARPLWYTQQHQCQRQSAATFAFGVGTCMTGVDRLMPSYAHNDDDDDDDCIHATTNTPVSAVCAVMTAMMVSSCLLVSPSYGAMTASQRDAYNLFVQGSRDVKPSSGAERMKQRMQDAGQRDKDRIAGALQLLLKAKGDQANGEYAAALEGYNKVIQNYSDLALSERARVGRALMEYQLGMVTQALLHLNDEEIALRGDAEVHAALASVYYVEKPEEVSLAEEQWDIASEFDTRYSDLDFVQGEKHWPPRLVEALKAFLTLT